MHKNLFVLALLVAAVVMFSVAAAPQKPQQGVLAPLKVGQAVAVKDHGGSYEISLMDVGVPMLHTVVEVGQDYLVVKDLADVTESRIPIYAIKAVVLLKTRVR